MKYGQTEGQGDSFNGCDSNSEVNMNFMRKSCLFNCWLLLLQFSNDILVHMAYFKVVTVVSFKWKYLKGRKFVTDYLFNDQKKVNAKYNVLFVYPLIQSQTLVWLAPLTFCLCIKASTPMDTWARKAKNVTIRN